MKKCLLAASFISAASIANAGLVIPPPPGATFGDAFFLGLSWTFGAPDSQAGVTLKYLTTDEPDSVAGTAGVTYNFDGTFGCDVGAAVIGDDAAVTLTYDFCKSAVQTAVGAIVSQ